MTRSHDDPGDAPPGLADQVAAVEAAITDLFRLASSRRLHKARQHRSGVDLSRTGWELLRRVEDLGPIRVSQLAELMDLSLPVTSRALQRLEDDGLVARRPDPADGRATRFLATRAGADARARIQQAMHDELATVLAMWPPAEREGLAALLPRLVADMRAVGAAPPPHL
ncbi:MAG TPA: MarR family transcriptional regulator [Acidimicrobiales bacterium]|nr:MarR family transcriptional regulator [Acidimicrobiales bacterium]